MRFQRQHGAAVGARKRRVALALLVLFLHAALAGASHIHRPGRDLPAHPSADAVRGGEAQAAPEATGHAECLLCRLQRNLASGLCNAGPATTEPHAAPLRLEAAGRAARAGIFPGVAHGRAPPHA